jgi:hypothetical protein
MSRWLVIGDLLNASTAQLSTSFSGWSFDVFPGQMPIAATDTVKHACFAAFPGRLWSRSEIKSDRFPGVAGLGLQA